MPQFKDIFRFNTHGALLAMPGFAFLLVGGVSAGTAMPASIAAAAAFSVGFGATKRVIHNRWAAMTLAGVGMTLVAFIGTILGNDPYMALAATALMGGLCGALISRDIDLWWVWLQIIIAFLLALHFPGNALDGLHRAVLVAGGSAIQIAAVGLMVGVIRLSPSSWKHRQRSRRATRTEHRPAGSHKGYSPPLIQADPHPPRKSCASSCLCRLAQSVRQRDRFAWCCAAVPGGEHHFLLKRVCREPRRRESVNNADLIKSLRARATGRRHRPASFLAA